MEAALRASTGAPLTPHVTEWATAVLGVPVYDHYAQTEAGMLINNRHHPMLRRPLKPGSIGHSMPGWKAVILKANQDELASLVNTGVSPSTLPKVRSLGLKAT